VVRGTRGLFGIWFWNRVATATTDESGSFSVYVRHKAKGARYRLEIAAANRAAHVKSGLGTYKRTVTMPGTVQRWDDVLSLDTLFTDPTTAGYFNITETLRHGYAYARSKRDPRERDAIPRASVAVGSQFPTFYNPVFDTLEIEPKYVFEDMVLLHEYAHFLEEQISSFPWIPSHHDGCTAKDAFGNVINSSEHAWMEAFASYFAQVVVALTPQAGLVGSPNSGTFSAWTLERQPSGCDAPVGGSGIELYVAASLWDVFDREKDAASMLEAHDTLERLDGQILQIVDRELDVFNVGPTMYAFREAWWRRGLPSDALDRIVGHHGIAGPFLPVPRPGPPPLPDDPGDCVPPVKLCD
jgi:hypothetical protein